MDEKRKDVMITSAWITIKERGAMRITKGKPSLRWDEVSMRLEIVLPRALFRKPRLEAKIDIPDEAAAKETITTKVIENVKEAIETATGLTFAINVVKSAETDLLPKPKMAKVTDFTNENEPF